MMGSFPTDLNAPYQERAERRLRQLAVSPELLIDIAKNTDWITVRVSRNALPADATLISVNRDEQTNTLYLVLASATFAPLYPGQIPPPLEPPSFERWFGPEPPPKEDPKELPKEYLDHLTRP